MESLPHPRNEAHVAAVMWNIRVDAATGTVVRALASKGIHSIVLKGPAFNEWYGPDSPRTYADGDIWVCPSDLDAAAETLAELGFLADTDETGLPGWWLKHATNWTRLPDGAQIDLHRKLQDVGATPQETWELLWPDSVPMTVGGQPARRLRDPALALYAVLHAAHHESGRGGGLTHVARALAVLPEENWRAAAEIAVRLDVTDPFAAGLRELPEGRELSDRLGLPGIRMVRTALQLGAPPPVALGFDQLASSRGLRRLEILMRKVFPPPAFIRHWWPPAARNGAMLAVGYLYRPVWLLSHAPGGWRAFREARRKVKSSS